MKHDHSNYLYTAWSNMRARCNNKSNPKYPNYGGRGITICDRWNNFVDFAADVGERPSKLHSLDRIDNDGNYEPGNIRWATALEQANNRSSNYPDIPIPQNILEDASLLY